MKKGLVLFGLLVFVAMAGMGQEAVAASDGFYVQGVVLSAEETACVVGGQPKYTFSYERGIRDSNIYGTTEIKYTDRSGKSISESEAKAREERDKKAIEYTNEFNSVGRTDPKTGSTSWDGPKKSTGKGYQQEYARVSKILKED